MVTHDDQTVAFGSRDDQNRPVTVICKLPDCSSPRMAPAPPSPSLGVVRWVWAPVGDGIAYVTGTPPNIWILPLDRKPTRQLTHFTDGRAIADFAWSRDGQRLAIMRLATTSDIVLFKGLRK